MASPSRSLRTPRLVPHGRWSLLAGFWLAGAAAVAAVVLGSCGASTTPQLAERAGTLSRPASHPAPAVGGSRSNPAPAGTVVTLASEFAMVVTGAELGTGATVARAHEGHPPEAGRQLVAIELTLESRASRSKHLHLFNSVGLITPSGARLAPVPASGPGLLDASVGLPPGGAVAGRLVFEVPILDVPTVVLVIEAQLESGELGEQRFLAIQ